MRRPFRITATDVRKGLKATLARVRKGAPAVIVNRDRIVGALVSPADYRLLRALRRREDEADVRDARAALAEIAEHGSIPWEQVKAEFDMSRQPSWAPAARSARLRSRIERNPSNARLFQALGRAHLKAGAFDEAEAAYRRSLELDPNDPWAHLYLGNLLYGRRRYRAALFEFDRGRELAPDLAMPYVCMADTHHCLGDLDRADEYYCRAVAVDPEDSLARENLKRWLDLKASLRVENS